MTKLFSAMYNNTLKNGHFMDFTKYQQFFVFFKSKQKLISLHRSSIYHAEFIHLQSFIRIHCKLINILGERGQSLVPGIHFIVQIGKLGIL